MSSLLPLRSAVEPSGGDPRVLRIDGDAADQVFSALGSETARSIYAALVDEPRTASEVAQAADTSLQNARYHLEKLLDADLVEIVDIWYSERGTEMKVYSTSSSSVVVFAGDEHERSRLRSVLTQVLGVVAMLGVLGFALQFAIGAFYDPTVTQTPQSGESARSADTDPTYVSDGGVDIAMSVLSVVPPAAWFVLGGVAAFAILLGIVYIQDRF